MADFRIIPEPKFDKDVRKILDHFKRAYDDLNNYLLAELVLDPTSPQIKDDVEILNRIDRRIAELEKAIKGDLTESVGGAFYEGQAFHLASIGVYKSVDEALKYVASSSFVTTKMEAMITDTYEDLLFATQNTSRNLKKVVRDTVAKSFQYGATRDLGRKTIGKLIEEELSKQGLSKKITNEGFIGVIDKSGRRWKLGTYADMVTRTKLKQAHTEGLRAQAVETGYDLAIISSHGATDACARYENMIISLHGETKGYPTYDEVKATGKIFHPNCEHSVHSIRDPELLPESLRKKAEKARAYYERDN